MELVLEQPVLDLSIVRATCANFSMAKQEAILNEIFHSSDRSVQLAGIRRLAGIDYYTWVRGNVEILVENRIMPLLLSFATDETCSSQDRQYCFSCLFHVMILGKDGREKAIAAGALDALSKVLSQDQTPVGDPNAHYDWIIRSQAARIVGFFCEDSNLRDKCVEGLLHDLLQKELASMVQMFAAGQAADYYH